MRGILLIAVGHPLYSHMAGNMAMSIKHSSGLPVCLAHHGPGKDLINPEQLRFFDQFIEIPYYYMLEKGNVEYIKSKMYIYELSPYDETLYLDVDAIWNPYKTVDDAFNELSTCDLQFAVRKRILKTDANLRSEWVKYEQVKEKYGFEEFYDLSSEFVYFTKTDMCKTFFSDALDLYSTHGLDVLKFAGGTPDEVPFMLSMEMNSIDQKCPFKPSYWQPEYNNKITDDVTVKRNFYMTSCGGAFMQGNIKRIYDNLTKHYARLAHLVRTPYELRPKAKILKEREKL